MKRFLPTLFALTLFFQLKASVVAYWRFESGGFLADSTGKGNNLTQVGNVSQSNLPGTGNGSAFLNPVPKTGAANGSTLEFDDNTVSGFTATDSSSFDGIAANGTFTLEAFINTGNSASSEYIVNQYDSSLGGSSQRSFSFQTNSQDGLSLFLGRGDLEYFGFHKSADNIFTANRDYYVAVSYDVSSNSSTFYWQDLSGSGSLQSASGSYDQSSGSAWDGSLGNPTLDVTVGHRNGSSQVWDAGGFLDELRISDTVLSQGDLLVSIPEPSSLMLMLTAYAGLSLFLRRRR